MPSSTPSTALSGRGLRTEYFDGPYWRAQGRPRFYRYILRGSGGLAATNISAPANTSKANTKILVAPVHREIADAPSLGTNLPATVESPTATPSLTSPLNRPFAASLQYHGRRCGQPAHG